MSDLDTGKEMSAGFINVDLDVESKHPLDYFAVQMEMGSEVVVLYCGANGGRGYLARLECADGGDTCEPDSIINRFCGFIEELDERARAEWDAASMKSFDLGFEVVGGNRSYQCPVRADTMSRLVALGGALAISIYHHGDG